MLQYFIIMVGLIAKMQRYDFFYKGEIKSEKYDSNIYYFANQFYQTFGIRFLNS